MVALAMGKMGAGELNYSSDIDLICLFDETRFDTGDEMEARAGFIRATRRIAATLGETTGEGYVFRTDLRLGPMRATPVCISMAAAERYYEAEGRSWERSAYIKARAAAGDIAAGGRFLETLQPFVWRRHLDFAMVQDTMDMRRRIREHKGLIRRDGSIPLEGHNMKLGAGGIREIEFFAQTRQLVAGGRDPSLRTGARSRRWRRWRGPTGSPAHRRAIGRALRPSPGNRASVADDRRRADPSPAEIAEGFDRLARFCGEADTTRFRARLEQRLSAGGDHHRRLLRPAGGGNHRARDRRGGLGHRRALAGYPALRSTRGQEIFERLKPGFLASFDKAAKPMEALQNFDGFLRGLPAGVQLFSMFEANPQLVDLIVDISATAPRLSRYLSRHSAVLDAVLDGRFFAPWPGREALVGDLRGGLRGRTTRQSLDEARRWQHEWHFRIGVHQLRGLITPETAGRHYTDLADAVVIALWPLVCAEVARRHGAAPGTRRRGDRDGQPRRRADDGDIGPRPDRHLRRKGVEMTEGRRPLDPRAWFAKATKSLVAALSAPTAAGKLYEVDMRLRPSGRQGPVATALASFERYQKEEAWTWEHMALTRARVLAGDDSLAADIEAVRRA
jgi:glutamate-ammonia-ligase adenylyltransferase